MAPSQNDAAERRLAAEVHEAMAPLWDLGQRSLLAWRSCEGGIEVVVAGYEAIVRQAEAFDRLLHGRRLMGAATFETALRLSGETAICIPLSQAASPDALERILRRYAITETRHRAVGLLDIVGFSKLEPMYQVAQLNSLQRSISNAHRVLEAAGIEVDLARSTTGDGYYVWNRDKGLRADLATYLVMLLTNTDNALARATLGPMLAPSIRSCFSIGAHFSYQQVERLRPTDHRYIVGDVTITLARIMDKCLPGQILLGAFERPVEGLGSVNAPTFARRAGSIVGELPAAQLRGRRLRRMRSYLTGRAEGERRFAVSRFLIRDKHGLRHAVFNQKFNVYLGADGESEEAVYLGRQHRDLAGFTADEVAVAQLH